MTQRHVLRVAPNPLSPEQAQAQWFLQLMFHADSVGMDIKKQNQHFLTWTLCKTAKDRQKECQKVFEWLCKAGEEPMEFGS